MSGVSRRSFFGRAAAATVAAPTLITEQIKQFQSMPSYYPPGLGVPSMGTSSSSSRPGWLKKLTKLTANGKIPEWRMREYRRDAEYASRTLDPDLIANRSMSLVARYAIQKERSLKRVIKNDVDNWIADEARQLFMAEFF